MECSRTERSKAEVQPYLPTNVDCVLFQSRKRTQKVHEIYSKLLEQSDNDPTLVDIF